MREMLKKKSTHLYIAHLSGGGTNSLSGESISVDTEGSKITLTIDLSSHLRVQQQDTNRYIDARNIAEGRDEVAAVDIICKEVTAGLARVWQRTVEPELFLSLLLDTYPTRTYPVMPTELANEGIRLNLNPASA